MNLAACRYRATALALTVALAMAASSVQIEAAQSDELSKQTIEPTVATLAQLRALVSKAYGPQPSRTEQITMDGKVTAPNGFAATYRAIYVGDNYSESASADGITEAGGRYQGQRWHQNQNGVVALRKFRHTPNDVDGRLLWRDAFVSDGDFEIVGEIKAPLKAYVLRVTVKDEPNVWLAFDAQTGLLNQAEVDFGEGPSTFAFSDYRKQAGMVIPQQYTENDANSTVTTTDIVVAVWRTPVHNDSTVQIPASRQLVEFPSGSDEVTIPMHMDVHQIIVRVSINGRGLDFILDSGTSGVLIDRGVASQLGLEEVGPVFRMSKGQPVRSFVACPQLDVGQLRMHNAILEEATFVVQPEAAAKYVGLLGYDFIQGVALKIDFEHESLDTVRPERFSPPPGTTAIDIRLDQGVPTISADVGGKVANNMMIDTGSDQPLIFSRFVTAQGWKMPDLNDAGVLYLYYPLATGKVPVALVQVDSVKIGDYYFGDMGAYITHHAPKFEIPEIDGLIGTSILRYFDVYFDYSHYKMYLVGNSLYTKAAEGK